MIKAIHWTRALLEHPLKIAVAALAIALASLLSEGTLVHLWNLKVEKQRLADQFQVVTAKNNLLKTKIEKAQKSDGFIGHEAREKLDLISEDELVFIFDN